VRPARHGRALYARIASLVHAIEANDTAKIEAAVVRLSQSRRVFAPLAFAVGAFALLFDGVRLLVSNWRLTLVQIIPAMWIWLAMFDLKAHVLHGKSLNAIRGPVLIPIGLVIVAITMASFFLNAVFAFAISQPGRPEVRPAVARARNHLTAILVWGAVVGIALALATTVVTRWGRPWFTVVLGIVVGVMMVCYVSVPARLIGAQPRQSRRDKLWTSAVAGTLGATVCTPPYLLGRLGLLMLGSKVLLIPGIIVFAVGVTLQAGATGAVRAIKMSTKLMTSSRPRGS
jgi:magnesium-transporting ATPase (P-type)